MSCQPVEEFVVARVREAVQLTRIIQPIVPSTRSNSGVNSRAGGKGLIGAEADLPAGLGLVSRGVQVILGQPVLFGSLGFGKLTGPAVMVSGEQLDKAWVELLGWGFGKLGMERIGRIAGQLDAAVWRYSNG